MKKLILILAFVGTAHANGSHNPLTGQTQSQGQEQTQELNSNPVFAPDYKTSRHLPNAPGLSSASTASITPIRKLKQRQVSFLLGGFTNIDMELDVIEFVRSNPSKREELAACIESDNFRKLRELESNACPK